MRFSPVKRSIHGVSLGALEEWVVGQGHPRYRAEQVLRWVYEKRVSSFESMSNLPAGLRERLGEAFGFEASVLERVVGAEDATRKFLLRLEDGALIESVLIPANPALYGEKSDRLTLCVSTQVGCAYGCKFCASGLDGWSRNLGVGEIVGQVLQAESRSGERVSNLVFMGMGEPLANFVNLRAALEILNAPWGVGIGARRITISTSGLVPQIRELAGLELQVRLAISLHGATDAVRNQIMPVNRKYPVGELLEACEEYTRRRKQKITFEYILIEGINDGQEEARELARVAGRIGAKVNCIPYNTVEGLEWKRPSEERLRAFVGVVKGAGVPVTLRLEKGHDIAAACGQLRRQTVVEPSKTESL